MDMICKGLVIMNANEKSKFTVKKIEKLLHDCAVLDDFEENREISSLLTAPEDSLPDEALDAAAGGISGKSGPHILADTDLLSLSADPTKPSNFI